MDTQINRVGLGTYPFAGIFSPMRVFNPISKKDAKKIVQSFLSQGGYYIDTAPIYGFGEVEKLLGEALYRHRRDTYYIATKCGYIDVEGKNFQTVQKSAAFYDVVAECEKSLKRLRLDYIDLYFVHWPDPNTPPEETMSALTKLQQDGKIREIGVSNVSVEQLEQYNRTGKVRFVQNRCNLLHRLSPKLEKYLIDNSIQLVPYQVIDRGLLTEKVIETRSDLTPEQLIAINVWVRKTLLPIAKRLDITIAQLSMAWALHKNYVSFILVGLTNPSYLRINLKANMIRLSDETIREIDRGYKKLL